MLRSFSACLGALLLAIPCRAADPLDLIPADAMGGVAVRNLDSFQKKADAFVKDAGIDLPMAPSEMLAQAFKELGVENSLDTTSSAAVVVVNRDVLGAEFGLGNLDKFLVVALPYKNLDKIGEVFGLKEGTLKPDKLFELDVKRDFGKFAYVRGKHIFIGNHDKAVLSVGKGKLAAHDLEPARRKALTDGDVVFHVGTKAWGKDWKELVAHLEREFADVNESDSKTAKEFVESFNAVQYVVGGIKLDGGLGVNIMAVYPKEGNEAARKFLTELRGGDGASSLRRLPEGNVIAATAAKGDGAKNSRIARLFVTTLLKEVVESNRFFAASDRPALLSIFQEIWHRLQGSRFALYKTANEQQQGLFSLVGIVDVEEPEKFLKDLQLLAKFGSGEGLDLSDEGKKATEAEIDQLIKDLGHRRFAIRDSAAAKLALAGEPVLPYLEQALKSKDLEVSRRAETLKKEIVQSAEARRKELLSGDLTRSIKPSFAFLDKTEQMEGFEVRTVGIKLAKKDAAAAPQFRQLLGPDWNRVRLAVHGKQIAVLVGSDVGLFRETLKNLKEDKPGLAATKVLQQQAKQTDAGRKVEVHFSAAMILALANAEDLARPGDLPKNAPLSTIALTVEPERVQLDFFLPTAEIKSLSKQGIR